MGKTSGETLETGLVPQPHGGALLPGGTGAGGRPRSEIRRAMRGDLEEVRKRLTKVLDRKPCKACGHKPIKDSDLIRMGEFFARFGIGEAKGYDEALVEALGAVVREELSDEVWERIRKKWVGVIGLHVRGG